MWSYGDWEVATNSGEETNRNDKWEEPLRNDDKLFTGSACLKVNYDGIIGV